MTPKNTLILLTIMLLFSTSYAQEETSDSNFVYTKTDKIHYGKDVSYADGFLNEGIIVDDTLFNIKDILFYKGKFEDNYGFFGITKGLKWKAPPVAGLVRTGEINLFESNVITTTYDSKTGTSKSKATYLFFNTSKTKELKYANYKNLEPILRNDTESMLHLNKYKQIRNRKTALSIASAGLGAFAVFIAVNHMNKLMNDDYASEEEEDKAFYRTLGGFLGFGLGAVVTGGFSGIVKLEMPIQLKKAIITYNKNHQ